MTHSMTGFASRTGTQDGATWAWEMRSVNARGLDLRLRLPESLAGHLDAKLRAALAKRLSRGHVNLTLRLEQTGAQNKIALDSATLDAVLEALDHIQDRALGLGITLAQPTAADVLAQRGVIQTALDGPDDTAATKLATVLEADFKAVLDDFCEMRAAEGVVLQGVLSAQLTQIETLTKAASVAAEARVPHLKDAMTRALARVLETATDIDEARVAAELALIAVKADVTEEIDRLHAHITAARDLLQDEGPKGRKLDFLTQEFNREANTLCSKSQDATLSSIGVDLKLVVDQMREQIQNVE